MGNLDFLPFIVYICGQEHKNHVDHKNYINYSIKYLKIWILSELWFERKIYRYDERVLDR